MSETTDTSTPARRVTVTYTEKKSVTVLVDDADFTANLGPVAARNAFGPRRDSLMTGYIERHRADFPEIPNEAEVLYVDVEV